jgi:hypothetical protein
MATPSVVIVLMTVVVVGSGAIEERAWDPFPPGNLLTHGATREEVATPFSPTVGAGLVASHAPPAHVTEDATPGRQPAWEDPRLYLLETAVQLHHPGWHGRLSAVGCAGCDIGSAWPISEARLNRSQ